MMCTAIVHRRVYEHQIDSILFAYGGSLEKFCKRRLSTLQRGTSVFKLMLARVDNDGGVALNERCVHDAFEFSGDQRERV